VHDDANEDIVIPEENMAQKDDVSSTWHEVQESLTSPQRLLSKNLVGVTLKDEPIHVAIAKNHESPPVGIT
jgi:hypothetical protein